MTGRVHSSRHILWLRCRRGSRPLGSVNRGVKRSSSSSITLAVAAAIDGPSGSGGDEAAHTTAHPFRVKDKVRRPKSHNIGPSDSSHWMPRTIS
jgi:hypothetical protein